MIRAIFFDFDGVLALNERGSMVTIAGIAEANPDVPLSRIRDCYYKFHQELLLGPKGHRDIWSDFCHCVGRDMPVEVLDEAFARTPINPEMIRLASQLAAGYRLGMITDNPLDRMSFLIDRYSLAALFDPILISAELGRLKDDAATFEEALRRTGARAGESVFIDNQEKNLSVPAGLGFKTYLFDPGANDVPRLKRQLAEWGVQVE